MSQQQQPVVFEIEIKSKTSPAQDPAIKKRLETQATDASPSLEDIHSKLKRAEELRK